MKNNRVFLSQNFQFLEVKLSVYLNRRVFVMIRADSSTFSTSSASSFFFLFIFFFFFFFLKFSQYCFEILINQIQQSKVKNIFLDKNSKILFTIEIHAIG